MLLLLTVFSFHPSVIIPFQEKICPQEEIKLNKLKKKKRNPFQIVSVISIASIRRLEKTRQTKKEVDTCKNTETKDVSFSKRNNFCLNVSFTIFVHFIPVKKKYCFAYGRMHDWVHPVYPPLFFSEKHNSCYVDRVSKIRHRRKMTHSLTPYSFFF